MNQERKLGENARTGNGRFIGTSFRLSTRVWVELVGWILIQLIV